MNKEIEWVNFIEKTFSEELKLEFSELRSYEDSSDFIDKIRLGCCDIFIIKEEREQDIFDAVINDIVTSYPIEKDKVFNRIRNECE